MRVASGSSYRTCTDAHKRPAEGRVGFKYLQMVSSRDLTNKI